MNKRLTEYKCPLCQAQLAVCDGDKINPKNGVSIFCENDKCNMADWAHAKNESEAFKVFEMKCGKK